MVEELIHILNSSIITPRPARLTSRKIDHFLWQTIPVRKKESHQHYEAPSEREKERHMRVLELAISLASVYTDQPLGQSIGGGEPHWSLSLPETVELGRQRDREVTS
ncbi:hypothetical protein RRG08_050439 [Elysia crispata]|uniref:Uncharacterized protein n=1 Tax=Elysia crispata TaxID=231223 RepID=A0AAE1DJ76_9GAST|nr:hypothetical protein RRG08_050439 [Elysia crispata]